MDKIKIGNYLKDLRNKKIREDGKSFSQIDLANALSDVGIHVSINAIDEWETGNTLPSPEKLEELSKIYNRTIDEILEGEDHIEVDYKKIYFISNEHWAMNVSDKNKIFPMNQEQILKITNRFRELSKIVINRPLSSNEEKEYRFLFENFYELTDYHKDYCKIKANNSYLRLMDSINQMRNEVRNMTDEEKYWEVQKFYEEVDDLRFSHWRNMLDLIANPKMIPNMVYIQRRFDALDDWQKDMFLAMFQNIKGYDYDPETMLEVRLNRFEEEYGTTNPDVLVKKEMKYLIEHGACYNKYFLNFYKKKNESKRIIDRLEELYNLCLKPIEIAVQNHETNKWETVKVENTIKNRFLNSYYFQLSMFLKFKDSTDASYTDLQQTYDYFITHDKIDDDTRLRLAKLEKIDTSREKKIWMAEYRRRIGRMEELFDEYKLKEKEISDGLLEIKSLEEKLKNGEKEYEIETYELVGGKDEKTIRDCILDWKSGLDYSEYLKTRDKVKTKELLCDLDKLSLEEIKEKYFKEEVIENE